MIVSLIGLATYASAQSRQQDPLQSARPDEHDRSGRDSITHIDSSTYARQHFVLVLNRQGKTRLAKHFEPYDDEEKVRIRGEVHRIIAPRDSKYQSNFVEYRSQKLVYRRYAGLFFAVCVDSNDNELAYLEAIHLFVEILDSFFGNVCELDLLFNFHKVYAVLDEVFLAGEIEEISKAVILSRLEYLESLP